MDGEGCNCKNTQEIPAIENGTVLDHLPADRVYKILSLLKINGNMTTIGVNLASSKHGKKAIIKVADHFLAEKDVNRITILAPDATLNIIKDYNVQEKKKLALQDNIEGIIKCSNPNCVTNLNSWKTRFKVVSRSPLKVKCAFCERCMKREEIDGHLM